MNNPLVSIIIPTYNRAHLIRETLDSIKAQTYTNWECIVIDDGSTDGTEKIVEEFVQKDARFQYKIRPNQQPKGANSCRNYGFELSKGEFVNWFDDDDVMLLDFIQTKMSFFEPEYELIICSGHFTDEKMNVTLTINLNEETFLFKDYFLGKLQVLTPSVLFRKTFLEGKELFSNKIKRGQESELFSRLFFQLPKSSYKILNSPLFLYRQHPHSKTFRNNDYVEVYKESQTFIAIENFKKSIELNDSDLICHFYKQLLDYFYRGLEHKHYKNILFILKKFTPLLRKINWRISVEFYLSGYFFLIIKRGSHKIEKYFKNHKLR
jgi:glycosyltransferase involved in cell wall biosynthesis